MYKDLTVGMNLHRERPNTEAAQRSQRYYYRYLLLRLWGPGRVAIRSAFEGGDNGGTMHSDPPPTEQNW